MILAQAKSTDLDARNLVEERESSDAITEQRATDDDTEGEEAPFGREQVHFLF